MVDGTLANGIAMPQITRITLRNLSLYRRRRTIEVEMSHDVLCLAGANGLGKSTFLAATAYSVLGVVGKPNLRFLGPSDYYTDLVEYSRRYFDGRVTYEDRDIAEVEVELSVGNVRFRLVRGLFDPLGIRRLEIEDEGEWSDYSGVDVSDSERHRIYVEKMCEASGLENFAQLVFLHLLVLTFDEQRRLMFWEPRATELALFLAFGLSSVSASQAESLQRTYDSAESRARNLQWQATGIRRRIDALAEVVGDEVIEDESETRDRHEALNVTLDSLSIELEKAEAEVSSAEVSLDGFTAALRQAEAAYEEAHRRIIAANRTPALHRVVSGLLAGEDCDLCGSAGPQGIAHVQGELNAHRCPLCASDVELADDAQIAAGRREMSAAATSLLELEGSQAEASSVRADLRLRRDHLEQQVRAARVELEVFRKENVRALLRASGEAGVIGDAAESLRLEMAELLEQKALEVTRRDLAQDGLDRLRDELTARFAEMEHEFVPLLEALANEFLGFPVRVDLDRKGNRLTLEVSFNGTERRSPESLSESQRFFIDIALRMALAQKLAHPGQPATLYIDTPEGSLDIAYEARAGRMFGRFSEGIGGVSNRIIMTANINTSQLLHELARVCTSERMQLIRMTEWTDLSEVQLEASDQFEAAYSAIEEALVGQI